MTNPSQHDIADTQPQTPSAQTGSSMLRASAQDLPDASLPVVFLMGVPFAAVTEPQCVRHVLDEIDAGRGGWIVTANLDFLRRLVRDASFSSLCAKASLTIADGMPVVWASRIQGTPLPERVAGSDLVSSLSVAAAERGRSVFLLGGAPGTADAAAARLRELAPELHIAGTACPPMGFETDPRASAELAEQVVRARPDIIYVALGSPKQELLIDRIHYRLPGAWWMGVGISFSYLCGHVRRAPKWLQRLGLEWLQRLCQEPRRLAKRYLLHGVPFAVGLLCEALAHRASGLVPHGSKMRTRGGPS